MTALRCGSCDLFRYLLRSIGVGQPSLRLYPRGMSRAGVSLTEVLVAAVLLAIGVGGTMGAPASARRMRDGATTRERVAVAAEDRLTWFERAGCAVNDTNISVADSTGSGVAESWAIEPTPGGVILRGDARGTRAGVTFSLRLETRRACQ